MLGLNVPDFFLTPKIIGGCRGISLLLKNLKQFSEIKKTNNLKDLQFPIKFAPQSILYAIIRGGAKFER